MSQICEQPLIKQQCISDSSICQLQNVLITYFNQTAFVFQIQELYREEIMGNDTSKICHAAPAVGNVASFESSQVQRCRPFKPRLDFVNPVILEEDDDVDFTHTCELTNQQTLNERSSNSEDLEDDTVLQFKEFDDKVKWNEFVKTKTRNYLQNYIILEALGQGSFGEVVKVKNKYTGQICAAKKISKKDIPKNRKQKLFIQMAILNQLDHPTIIKLIEVYDYLSNYVLIFQCVEGALDLENYTRSLPDNRLNQIDAICIMKQVFRSLLYLREANIVHRDIKAQNLLIQPSDKTVKLIDFGTAARLKKQKYLTTFIGTLKYMAPEIIKKQYMGQVDVWSCGVLLHRLITGKYPFSGHGQTLMKNIEQSHLTFDSETWKNVSASCKNLIKEMLDKNPKKRISVDKCLKHPWIKSAKSQRNINQQEEIFARMSKFKFINSLQAIVNTYIVSQISIQCRNEIIQAFKSMDKNCDGVISYAELREALELVAQNNGSRAEMEKIMRLLDLNKSGVIDYTEFLVGAIDPSEYLTVDNLEKAFHFFDIDHSGVITIDQITIFLEGKVANEEQIKYLFGLVDQNNDGLISKEEFVSLLMKMMNYYKQETKKQDEQPKRSVTAQTILQTKKNNEQDQSLLEISDSSININGHKPQAKKIKYRNSQR